LAALDLAKKQVKWALETAPKFAPKGDSPALTSEGEMWIVAMGFSNAFYAVRETLRNVEIQNDPLLRDVYHKWWSEGAGAEFDRFLGTFRNALTHQGKFDLDYSVSWEVDHDHDTVHPRFSYPYAYIVCSEGHRTDYTFPEWIHFCFNWWDRGLKELERLYVAAGGMLPENLERGWSWAKTNRPLFATAADALES
jgi:hypothetical protein